MMRPSDDIDHVWLAREPQDFRKVINGLSIVVEEHLRHDLFSVTVTGRSSAYAIVASSPEHS
jgi:hypothetical protein